MVIDKKSKFVIKIAKNIANMATEQERTDALQALQSDIRPLIATTVEAILSGKRAS